LVSPARQEIIDTVEALGGEATVVELAAQLGRPADGLYYHLRPLVKAGLLVHGDDPEADRYRTPSRTALSIDYDPANARAVKRVVASMLRIAKRDFDAAFAIPGVAVRGPRRALWAGRGKGWVSPAELAEINALLARITSILRKPRAKGRTQLVSLCFVLAPIRPRSPRRSGGASPRRTS